MTSPPRWIVSVQRNQCRCQWRRQPNRTFARSSRDRTARKATRKRPEAASGQTFVANSCSRPTTRQRGMACTSAGYESLVETTPWSSITRDGADSCMQNLGRASQNLLVKKIHAAHAARSGPEERRVPSTLTTLATDATITVAPASIHKLTFSLSTTTPNISAMTGLT